MYNLETKNKNQALALNTKGNKAALPDKILNSKVGKNKLFSPANKEWKNSTYAYNKNSIRSISILDKMAGKMIKGYFNLSNRKKIARSKRMRTLIRRSTVKRLFVSRPEIKQSADKVMITVYTFDREKQFYIRKLYFYNKSLNLYNIWLNKTLSSVSLSANRYRKRNSSLNNISKRTLNPLYTSSMVNAYRFLSKKGGRTALPLNVTSRISRNKTYIHKLLLNKVSLLNHPFLSVLRKRQKIQKKSNVKKAQLQLFNNIRKNYFSKLFAKKLELRKKPISYKRFGVFFNKKTLNGYNNKLYGVRLNKRRFNANKRRFNANKQKRGALNYKKYAGPKIRIPYFNLKLKNEMKFFFFKLAYVKKFDYIRKLFFFSFMKYALSLFQTKVNIYNKADPRSVMRNNELVLEFTVNNPDNSNLATHYKLIKNYSNNKLKLIQRINMELLQFLDLTLAKNNHINAFAGKEKIYSLYEYFKANYFRLFIRKYLKRELLALNYYTKFMINQYKFGKFLPGLKLLISKIYSKKVELNLVNLKYSHLNSDIYTETIATKLKKKIGLLKVLRRSLNLVRTPYEFFSVNNAANINNLQSLTIFKSLNVEDLSVNENVNGFAAKDNIDVILNKLYPNSLAQSFNLKSFVSLASENSLTDKSENLENVNAQSTDMLNILKAGAVAKNVKILNQIRYKWVTGVRLEAAGRLTRRFTASRSVFKLKYKGNLKNIDYTLKTEKLKQTIPTIMLRNSVKPNLQYTFAKSKKRIGAFGIKGWINSY